MQTSNYMNVKVAERSKLILPILFLREYFVVLLVLCKRMYEKFLKLRENLFCLHP